MGEKENMTYEDVANWIERNVPMGQAENYEDWFNMAEEEFLNSGHFLPEQTLPLIKKKWDKAHPTTSSGQEEEIASRFERFEQQADKQGLTKGELLERRISKFPEDLEFTPKQIAQFTGMNKNTVRRELQEFVEDGTLQRVGKGRYRKAP